MYLEHFGLVDKPFSLIPDPNFLHFSGKHKTALSMLEYGLYEQTGITVVTGEIGSGKTTLLRHLLSKADQHNLTIGLINNTHEEFGDLSQWIALALGLPHEGRDKVTLFREIQKFFIDEWSQGRRVVLIVDEAQNIGASALEELRLYTNINSDGDYLLQIILVGQPELRELLKQPELIQIAQRVSVEYHIEPLDWQETANYIRHRLVQAAKEESKNEAGRIFDSASMAVIFFCTGGVPRLINNLCDLALVHAYALGVKTVNYPIILEIAKGKKIGGVNRFSKNKPQLLNVVSRVKEAVGVDLLTEFPHLAEYYKSED